MMMKAWLNGINLGFELLGSVQTPIVLIHGFGLDRSIWREMTRMYMAEQRVILVDMRGHGESDAPQSQYAMSQMAEDVVRLLDFLEVDQAIICGHSMGGYVSLAFAEQFPYRLAGLGLITTRADADTEEKKAGRYQLVESVKQLGCKALADSLAPRLSKDQDVVEKSYRLLNQTDPQGIIGSALGMANREDHTDLLSQIAVPALVVAGAEDQIMDIGVAEKMAALLPNREFLLIPNAGHMPMWEEPQTLADGLLMLINRVELRIM
jgi:pimeloyl-ACP methyl ester carboxylesterase